MIAGGLRHRAPAADDSWLILLFLLTPLWTYLVYLSYHLAAGLIRALLSVPGKLEQLSVAEVAKKMDEVNMGRMTVQTMVFEPAILVLHLSIGPGPTSAKPLRRLDLKPLLGVASE